jgi:hypothetical protein
LIKLHWFWRGPNQGSLAYMTNYPPPETQCWKLWATLDLILLLKLFKVFTSSSIMQQRALHIVTLIRHSLPRAYVNAYLFFTGNTLTVRELYQENEELRKTVSFVKQQLDSSKLQETPPITDGELQRENRDLKDKVRVLQLLRYVF